MADEILIRDSRADDLPMIHSIYAEQVLHGSASFEEIPPTLDEMADRRAAILAKRFPYLVATVDGAFAGYAYASHYRTRSAYRHSVENSVYVEESHRGQGVGKRLLLAIIAMCEERGYRTMIGIVGDSANLGSVQLHISCGFKRVGTLERVGYKHERWLDTVILQRTLDPSDKAILSPQ